MKVICQLRFMQLQKEMKSNPKQPSCKNCAAPKNVVKIAQWQPRNGCNGKKINTDDLNLLQNLNEMWRRQHKFT